MVLKNKNLLLTSLLTLSTASNVSAKLEKPLAFGKLFSKDKVEAMVAFDAIGQAIQFAYRANEGKENLDRMFQKKLLHLPKIEQHNFWQENYTQASKMYRENSHSILFYILSLPDDVSNHVIQNYDLLIRRYDSPKMHSRPNRGEPINVTLASVCREGIEKYEKFYLSVKIPSVYSRLARLSSTITNTYEILYTEDKLTRKCTELMHEHSRLFAEFKKLEDKKNSKNSQKQSC